jgi:four helix bundle protein
MDANPLVMLSKAFAVDIITLCSEIKENRRGNSLINQLLRCGTSIGANIHEANYAASRDDFINKLQIAMKECYETEYWLDIFCEAKILKQEEHKRLHTQCSKIRKILTASITTAKKNAAKDDL